MPLTMIRRASPLGVALALLLPVALLVTVVSAWTDHAILLVNDRPVAVGYGVPYDWLMQENMLTPPQELMPYELSPDDIRESPITVAWGAFAVDLLLAYAVLAGVLVIFAIANAALTRSPPER